MLEISANGPLLVFGGPYSNLRATQALREEATRLGIPPSHAICTGDVVAYCAEPEETTRAVADWGCHVIQGNCEQQLAERAPDCACNFDAGSACDLLAKGWYPYSNARISDDMRAWMGQLPTQIEFRYNDMSFRVVHGGIDLINRWVFSSETLTIDEECQASGADITIAGHCGLPFIARSGHRTWFNPGVIGMPANDGTTDIWYGLIHAENDGVRLSTHRLAYDHVAAAAAMRRYGYANGYARALVTGRWPSLDILPDAEKQATGKRLRPRVTRIATPAGALLARGAA